MAFAPQVFTVPTMVTGASLTTIITVPGNFLYMYLQVPTMTGGYSADTSLHIQGSADGTNFFRFSNPENNTTPVAANDFTIISGATQRMVNIPNFCMPYLKIETTAVATNGVASQGQFKIICVSNQ